MNIRDIIENSYKAENNASREELIYLLDNLDEESKSYLIDKAHETRMKTYGNKFI